MSERDERIVDCTDELKEECWKAGSKGVHSQTTVSEIDRREEDDVGATTSAPASVTSTAMCLCKTSTLSVDVCVCGCLCCGGKE